MPAEHNFERLPQTVVPEHYDLQLKPNLKTFQFEGQMKAKIDVKSCTDKIVLHAVDLAIKSVEFMEETGTKHLPYAVTPNDANETLSISFPEPLAVGAGELSFQYTGEINDKMRGWYRSRHDSPDEEKYGAVTKFEPTDARRCFPCWDEPALKALFDITLIVPNNKIALANMPVKSEINDPGNPELKIIKFETSPKMSTYLVSMVVGEYDYLEDSTEDGVKVRVYTPVGLKEDGRFALSVALKVLPFYKDYFKMPYPLPKLDIIAITDFSAGAMGSWGLLTYRDACLLVEPHDTSAERRQWIALVISHELAHQWFGNLVTMEWWTDLWLNEGYASFVEFLCIGQLYPEFDIWTPFVSVYTRALELDWLKGSHPLEVPVVDPGEIDEVFDDLSFNKGASVIRMLHNYVGDEDYRKGLSMYLTRHQFKCSRASELWAALEEASDKPVKAIMASWTKQPGFPVIHVTSRQEDKNRILTLTQRRFCLESEGVGDDALWMIPINISSSDGTTKSISTVLLQTNSTECILTDVGPDDWVKVNPCSIGFYRTQYSTEMLQNFVPAIKNKDLPAHDRLGLLDDMFALVQTGLTSTVEALKLIEAFTEEDNCAVWSSINSCLAKVAMLMSHTDFEESYNAYGRKLMAKISAKLGWDPKDDDRQLDTLLRSWVIDRLAWFGDKGIIEEAKQRFENHITGKQPLPIDLRSPVYEAVLSVGDESTIEEMLKLYRQSDDEEEKCRLCRALGSIQDEEVLKKMLVFGLSEDVCPHNSIYVMISVGMSKLGRDLAWEFIKENWNVIWNTYQDGFLLSRLIQNTTENFASEERAIDLERFFEENPAPGIERTVEQSAESIRMNAAWLARDRDVLHDYLATFL